MNYRDFKSALNDIEWLNKTLSDEMIEKMNSIEFPTRDLL